MRRPPASPLREIGLAEARKIAVRQLCSSPRLATKEFMISRPLAVCAEALRTSLWALSHSGNESVTTTKLLYAAARLVLPVKLTLSEGRGSSRESENTDGQLRMATLDQAVRDQLRAVLEGLEAIGDLASLPQGRWLPAPIRVVHLRASGKWLLVGGHPTMLFPDEITNSITQYGVARLLLRAPSELGYSLPEQRVTDWCQIPVEPLKEWTERKLAEAQLSPFEGDASDFEVYAPLRQQAEADGSRRVSWKQRWRRMDQMLPDGRYLVRLTGRSGSKRYAIGQVTNGVLCAMGPIESGFGDVRRLMYGIDVLSGRPRKVMIFPEHSAWKFRVWAPFPPGEQRLILALSSEYVELDDRGYSGEWVVPNDFAYEVAQMLRRIHLDLIDANRAPFDESVLIANN